MGNSRDKGAATRIVESYGFRIVSRDHADMVRITIINRERIRL